ncbi:dethiobiotin synthase [Methylophilaceae bacterium]|jgi:dethiobiotin synthetase|nr:dethiobiotin synthase [Methylophilaceae bacterium]
MKKVFITGTGTGVGKTYITSIILKNLLLRQKVIGIKPISAGISQDNLINEDVQTLLDCQPSIDDHQKINFYSLKKAVSPHIGAEEEGIQIDFDSIKQKINALEYEYDRVLIEGVGGLLSPVDQSRTNLDLIKHLDIPVIIIIGLKLGCINDALLTQHTLQSNDIKIVGWIGNQIDPEMKEVDKNIEYLKKNITSSCLEVNKYGYDNLYLNI